MYGCCIQACMQPLQQLWLPCVCLRCELLLVHVLLDGCWPQ